MEDIEAHGLSSTDAFSSTDDEYFIIDGKSKCRKRQRTTVHACTYTGCDKTFNRPSRLLIHTRTHTGEVNNAVVADRLRPFRLHNYDACWAESSTLRNYCEKRGGSSRL